MLPRLVPPGAGVWCGCHEAECGPHQDVPSAGDSHYTKQKTGTACSDILGSPSQLLPLLVAAQPSQDTRKCHSKKNYLLVFGIDFAR